MKRKERGLRGARERAARDILEKEDKSDRY